MITETLGLLHKSRLQHLHTDGLLACNNFLHMG